MDGWKPDINLPQSLFMREMNLCSGGAQTLLVSLHTASWLHHSAQPRVSNDIVVNVGGKGAATNLCAYESHYLRTSFHWAAHSGNNHLLKEMSQIPCLQFPCILKHFKRWWSWCLRARGRGLHHLNQAFNTFKMWLLDKGSWGPWSRQ